MSKRKLIILSFLAVLFGVVIIQNASFSQSKKKQIEALNFKIDSVNQVIVKERNTQKTIIVSLEIQESKSKQKVDSLIKEINSIENQINAKQIDKQIIESDFLVLKKNIDKQRDSLSNISTKKEKENKLVNEIILDSIDFLYQYGVSKYDFIIDKNPQSNPNNSKLNGLFTTYWPKQYSYNSNGKKQIYASGKYRNGLKDGQWSYFDCSGNKISQGNYLNGKKTGEWFEYNYFFHTMNCSNELFTPYVLNVIIEYYELANCEFNKIKMQYSNGIIDDTILYYNNNELIFRADNTEGILFYKNNQPLLNQRSQFNYPTLEPINNSNELLIYNQNGKLRCKLNNVGILKRETFYNSLGGILSRGEYIDGAGVIEEFDMYGEVKSKSENYFGTGKYGPESPCQ